MAVCKTGSFNDLHISVQNGLELLRSEHKNSQDNSSPVVFKRVFRAGQIFWVPNQCWRSGDFRRAYNSHHPGLVLKDSMASVTSLMVPGSSHTYVTEDKIIFRPEKAVSRLSEKTCFILTYRESVQSSMVGEHLCNLHESDVKRLEDKVRCCNGLV
jgi:hypothetical protein